MSFKDDAISVVENSADDSSIVASGATHHDGSRPAVRWRSKGIKLTLQSFGYATTVVPIVSVHHLTNRGSMPHMGAIVPRANVGVEPF